MVNFSLYLWGRKITKWKKMINLKTKYREQKKINYHYIQTHCWSLFNIGRGGTAINKAQKWQQRYEQLHTVTEMGSAYRQIYKQIMMVMILADIYKNWEQAIEHSFDICIACNSQLKNISKKVQDNWLPLSHIESTLLEYWMQWNFETCDFYFLFFRNLFASRYIRENK